ncbi:hypothetical protein [Absidia glauca]|uniref:Uncharacterized protein n=1 Tax=Absidia glauca TaxID=4829 RepID=A0A168LJQ3_ABSGL|nr:hypothetical protein [Absidia glauca]
MVAFLLAPSVSSSSCGVVASSVLPETMPGWQPSAVDWSLWIKKEVIFDDLLDLSSPLPPVAAVDPALTVLPAVSVSPSASVLCSSFSPRPLEDSDDDDEESDNALRELVRGLVPPFGLRRMIMTRVLEADPWLTAGGPAPVSVGDVEETNETTAEFDAFSTLLGLNDLFGWAMEPTPSGL